MRPAVLLRLAPDSLRGMAAGAAQLTAWVTARLRDQVLAAAFDQELESFEHRAMVVKRAGPFRADGFPVPLDPPGVAARPKRRSPLPLLLAGVGGTGLLIAVAYVALALSGNHSTGALSSWTGLPNPSSKTSASGTSNAAAAGSGTKPSAGSTASHGGPSGPPSSTPAIRPSSALATPTAPAPPPKPAVTPSSAAPRASSGLLAGGGVNVSPGSLLYQPQPGNWRSYGAALTLINPTSSPLNWSISLPHDLRVWGPTSGTLSPNSNNTKLEIIYVSRGSGNGQAQTQTITLEPGNVHVTVTIRS
jgi:hypothetical protein